MKDEKVNEIINAYGKVLEEYATFLCSYNWFDYIHTYLDGGLKNCVQDVFRKTSATNLN